MKKESLYKKFFKLGSRIDNLCFRKIENDLVDGAIQNLWCLIYRDYNDNEKEINTQRFAQRFYKIKQTLENQIQVQNSKINSTEFKDCKLLVKVGIKNKFKKLKTALNDLLKFEQQFLVIMRVSLQETNNNMIEKQREKANHKSIVE